MNAIYTRLSHLASAANTTTLQNGSSRSRAGRARYIRYYGLPANANARSPPRHNLPFQSLVSESWVQRTGHTQLVVFPDPPEYTILGLEIPDDDLEAEDILFYADIEDNDGFIRGDEATSHGEE